DVAYPEYRDKINLGNIVRFYVTHPARTAQLLQRGARELLVARVDYLGSYGEESGQPPRQLEHRVPLVSAVVQAFAPLGLFVLLPLWSYLGWLGVRAIRRAGRPGAYETGLAVLFLVVSAGLQFGVAALSEGHEGTKHQTLTLYCTLLAAVLAVLLIRGGPVPRTAPATGSGAPEKINARSH
ncbi:MAG: hypothetical protein ACREX8_09105, partial [Gammaproteobacteria bacterium]